MSGARTFRGPAFAPLGTSDGYAELCAHALALSVTGKTLLLAISLAWDNSSVCVFSGFQFRLIL